MFKPFVLVAALFAATAADAEPLCEAIKHAAEVGASDNLFTAFRRDTPAPEGFACRINMKGRLGAYACSMPAKPGTQIAQTKALIDEIRACVAPSLVDETNPREGNAVLMISRKPKTWVIVNGVDDPTRIYMNVLVSTAEPYQPSTFQLPTGVDSSTSDAWHPFDPGLESPRSH